LVSDWSSDVCSSDLATLDVCARALKAEGAEWVGAITYVRTL